MKARICWRRYGFTLSMAICDPENLPFHCDRQSKFTVPRKMHIRCAWQRSPHFGPDSFTIADLQVEGGDSRITTTRLWNVTKRFFVAAAGVVEQESPKTAQKLRRASPHWIRHTHATHALARGVELTTVWDNLRHASVSTTSMYLHTDQAKRARQLRDAFGTPNT